MVFKIPKFQNDEILYEKELYALTQLSLELFRWQSISQKNFGFFAPFKNNFASIWNLFDWKDDSLFINNLFIISPEGYPLIVLGQRQIENKQNKRNLYAILYFDQDSQSYKDDGYRIEFKWDIPEIESPNSEEPYIIKLGQLTKNNVTEKLTFEIIPPILQLQGTSRLWSAALKLQANIEKYIEKLVAVGERNIDVSEYLDRLERLNIFSHKNDVAEFINLARLTLKSAQGFYYRLIDDEDKRYQYHESYKNYRGRALEYKLAENYSTSTTEQELFDAVNELLLMEVETGQQQQEFVEKLAFLFASDGILSRKLQVKRQRILQSEGYPQYFDVQRLLYRYDLRHNQENQVLVVEFHKEPTNVAFIFTNESELETTHLTPLKHIKHKNSKDKRYELPTFNTESYLFIAAPEGIISQVELVNK
jgi:hypothetical protein